LKIRKEKRRKEGEKERERTENTIETQQYRERNFILEDSVR
jgi:hypothetical protein